MGLYSIYIRNNLKAEGNLANIDEFVVDEIMRGQQIGKLLLEDAEAIASKNGCKSLELESSFHREDAHRFYIKTDVGSMGTLQLGLGTGFAGFVLTRIHRMIGL